MDPSYNNGGISGAGGTANTPGVKPGVIASGSVDESANSSAGGLMGAPVSRPKSTPASGDIMLSGSNNSKRSNKGLLIAGAILIVIALVSATLAVVLMNGGRGGESSEVVTVDSATALNNVTRFMLFGNTEASGDISNVKQNDATYNKAAMLWGYEEQKEYFNTLTKYTKELSLAMKNNEMAEIANNLNTNVTLFGKMAEIAYTDVLYNIYINDGSTSVQDYLAEFAALEISDDVSIDIASMSGELGAVAIQLYSEYQSKGCIVDGEVDSDCATNITEADSNIMNLTSEFSKLRLKIRKEVNVLSGILFSDIETLNGLNEETNESE